jgi:glutamate-1-semialdehyde 2,1-aminomutase
VTTQLDRPASAPDAAPAPAAPATYPASKALYEAARDFTTEGVQHAGRFQKPHPIYMERSQGSRIWDADGNEYIDFSLGSGPLLLGHNHPKVIEAVTAQLARAQLYGTPTSSEVELARRIHEAVPSAEVVRFFTTGTEACFMAIRLARAFTGRSLVVKHIGAFHGAQDYVLTGLPRAGGVKGQYPGLDRRVSDATLAIPFNDLPAFDAVLAEHGDDIAAFIMEPALRGVVPPDPGYLEAIRETCTARGIVLIFDEVVSCFRMGPAGAEGYFGVRPDISAMGKVIGGGFPVGAVTGRRDILDALAPGQPPEVGVFAASTWYGYPMAMVAGAAALDVLFHDGGFEQLESLGAYFRSRFGEIFRRVDVPGQVLGYGPINKVILNNHQVRDLATSQPQLTPEAVIAIKKRLFQLGIFMQGPGYVPGFGKYLSVQHTNDDIDRAADAFETAVREQAGNVSA